MSRTVTPPQAQPSQPQQGQVKIPHEKVAMRAYEKWVKRGRPQGNPDHDWYEAEKELIQEFFRNQGQGIPPQGVRR
jgi:hypothetical protein